MRIDLQIWGSQCGAKGYYPAVAADGQNKRTQASKQTLAFIIPEFQVLSVLHHEIKNFIP